MPIIAVVGEQNTATQMMVKYLSKLFEVQNLNTKARDEFVTTLYGEKATYPEWQFHNFTSKEDLFSWTSAENYTFTDGLQGVCFGFQLDQDSNNAWNLQLYFSD